ncbi:hypothetical protein PC117_g20979 [Phytophthora cactorum]|uniref:Uncharacterized protein n=1 Tax=Phytophthora cactorum TaxID=29920 RepID=A0A8T1BIV9_9STRA|nr:hypothetical protein PC117_g20979 [Phytophthora cactorum]
MSWMRFAKDLYDTRIEQICILSDIERMKSEAGELKQLHASWDSLKAGPFYDVLWEHKGVLPDAIPAELPQIKVIQNEIDLVPGMCPLPRDQMKASRRLRVIVKQDKFGNQSPAQCTDILRSEATEHKSNSVSISSMRT